MEHGFYKKSDREQKYLLIKTGVLIFTFSAALALIALSTKFYLLLFFIPIIFLIAAPFIDLPMGKKSGKFIYHSPLFISEKPLNDKIIIHGGTLFDYVFTIEKKMNANARTRFVLLGYVKGLLGFIQEHERGLDKDYTVRGTSYFVNERTAMFLGFSSVRTDFAQLIILLFNYIPLMTSGSYVKKGLTFPRLSEIKTYEAKLSQIIEHKSKLIQLKKRLEFNE